VSVAAVEESVEIARSPEEVFAYLSELDRHGEWQEGIVSSKIVTPGPTGLGTRVTDTRKMGGQEREVTYEVVAFDPPHRVEFKVTDGPVRPHGVLRVEPLDGGTRARVTLELDFEGHGAGRMLLPLVKREARKQVPQDQARLKARLEGGV
jgi:uncharacterized protein YndB with AHSA1/START domain